MQSTADLAAFARSGPIDVKAAVQTLADTWVQHRPRLIADAVLARIAT